LRRPERSAIQRRDKLVREHHEKEVMLWDQQWKDNRVHDAMSMREGIHQKYVDESKQTEEFQRQSKHELAAETRTRHEAELAAEAAKFKTGEAERKTREENRQSLEETKHQSKAVDFSHKTDMFLRDEQARATSADLKAKKEKARLDSGKKRQTDIEKERLAAEKAERQKKAADKKAFHEAQRIKAAEKVLDAERTRREIAEFEAKEKLKDVERVLAETSVTAARAAEAKSMLDGVKAPAGGDNGTNRTAYEAKMRETYGTGEGLLYGKGDGKGIEPSALDFW